MWLDHEFYQNIINNRAGDATPLLAAIALHIGHDPQKYPMSLSEILQINRLRSAQVSAGQNELFVVEYLRSNLMEGSKPWNEEQVKKLDFLARIYYSRQNSDH